MDDAAAAGEEARGRVTHLTVCADDRRATGPHCVTLPLRLP
jgi:hypothetical protein